MGSPRMFYPNTSPLCGNTKWLYPSSCEGTLPSPSIQFASVNHCGSDSFALPVHVYSVLPLNVARNCTAVSLFTVMVWLSVSPEMIAHVSPDQDTKSQSAAGVALSVTLEPRPTHASAVPEAEESGQYFR